VPAPDGWPALPPRADCSRRRLAVILKCGRATLQGDQLSWSRLRRALCARYVYSPGSPWRWVS
jgi:hypothetical protein